MLRVGEPVWHKDFKRGVIAYSLANDVRVLFDDLGNNPLISTEPPPYISKKNLENLSGEEKLKMIEVMEEAKAKGAPLEGHVIEFPGGGEASARTLTQYKYPIKDNYYQVIKVGQPFAGMKWDEKGPGKLQVSPKGTPAPAGERKFYPAENIVDLTIQDADGGKYLIQLDRAHYPSIYVARKVPAESLAVLFDEGDLFWPEEPATEEQPVEPQPTQEDEQL